MTKILNLNRILGISDLLFASALFGVIALSCFDTGSHRKLVAGISYFFLTSAIFLPSMWRHYFQVPLTFDRKKEPFRFWSRNVILVLYLPLAIYLVYEISWRR